MATAVAVAALLGLSLSARASVSMTVNGGVGLSGDPSGAWSAWIGPVGSGENITTTENVGIYQLNVYPTGPSYWAVCISPQGYVDGKPYSYNKLLLKDATPLNSPSWVSGSLPTAAAILNNNLTAALQNKDQT